MKLTLSLTHLCNLRCTYCYGGRKLHKTMTPDVMLKGLELGMAHPSSRIQVAFFGGEPLLETLLLEQTVNKAKELAKAEGKSILFSLTTNGTLLTDKNLELIDRLGIHLAVSIDGTQEAHDSGRVWANGRGSFEVVNGGLLRALKTLRQVDTISVVHPKNVELLPDSFSYLTSLGVRRLAFNMDYDANWDEEALVQLENAYQCLVDRAVEWYRAGNDFSVGPLHAKIISQLKGGFCDSDRCAFGCGEIAVSPGGRLYPCDRLIGEDGPDQDSVVIGHVDRGIDTKTVQALRQAKDTIKPDCEGCALIDRCMWWCGCVNHTLTGRTDSVSGLLCRVEQITVDAADRLAATLFAEGNRPFLNRYYLAATALNRLQKKTSSPQ